MCWCCACDVLFKKNLIKKNKKELKIKKKFRENKNKLALSLLLSAKC